MSRQLVMKMVREILHLLPLLATDFFPVTTALDKEVHQDHHHTSVQPVKDREVMPEQHSHRMAGVKHTTHEHDRPDDTKAKLEAERAQFQNASTTHDTKHSQSVAPTVAGEHVHHHGACINLDP